MSDPSVDQIRELYSRLHERSPEPLVLPATWLDATLPFGPSVVRPGARVLVAGCGSGHELRGFQTLPDVEVVGVDFSEVALEEARRRVGPGVQILQADLTEPGLAERIGRFDLVLCNAVADYVPDSSALLRTLAECLAPRGVLYLGSNTTDHARKRVQAAVKLLGVEPSNEAAVRHALRVLDAARPDAPKLADLEQGVIEVDLLVPFAHHRTLSDWVALAEPAGLHLHGTIAAPTLVSALPDADAVPLYGLGTAGLALLMDIASDGGGRAALFARTPPISPPFGDLQALRAWVPRGLGLGGVAPMTGDPHALLPITVPLPGWGDWSAVVPAWVVELARRADGSSSIGALADALEVAELGETLVLSLYRLWLCCVVRLDPPVGAGTLAADANIPPA